VALYLDEYKGSHAGGIKKMSSVMKRMAFILSPAYPAAWLLFGMLFALAAAHFLAAAWSKTATAVFYVVPLGWVSVLAWQGRRHVWPVTALDVLFVGFVLLVSASLAFQSGFGAESGKYARFLPFMVVIPYVCGRLMRVADVALLSRTTLIAGVAMLPLLLLDRYTSPGQEGGRWSFFGYDHAALLVGALLAAALLALCVRVLGCCNPEVRNDRSERWIYWGLMGLVTVLLVWVKARGWLLAGLAAVTVACLTARHRFITTRIGLLAVVLAIAGITVVSLPRLDPQSGRFYALLLTPPTPVGTGLTQATAVDTSLAKASPILGEASCRPLKEGTNSVAIRWVLYQEAVAMFTEHSYLGVGAARFGEHSCTGPGGFPHSTILQGFAELGLVGGGLLVGLLALAAVTLVHPILFVTQGTNWSADSFVLALFAAFFVGDQIYGNYFMSVGMWLMLGIASSMRANERQGCVSRG